MKQLVLICLSLFAFVNLYSSNYLKIGDPRKSWYTEQGTIDEAILHTRPVGLYMENELFLTFSAKGTTLTSSLDTLEVVLNFDLPENAIVHDSWLWIGTDPVKAKLLDKWTASSIYENIVKRRRDPSILSKINSTQYELRIFPMAGNETRKVKITWLTPVSWNNRTVSSRLPIAILNTSKIKPANFQILAWECPGISTPRIINDSTLNFTAKNKLHLGNYYETNIPSEKFTEQSIGYVSSFTNGYYFSRSNQETEGIYQLAIFPTSLFDSAAVKKIAILVDFDATRTALSSPDLLNILKTEMLNNLNETDSFNLLFSNLTIQRYSGNWIAATKQNIETAFKSLNNPLSSYSNLISLLGEGVDFIQNHGNDGKIILLSNSAQYGEYKIANTLINDVLASMDPIIPIHISDFSSVYFPSYYLNGKTFFGNEYFYSNLSKMTSGSYQSSLNGGSVSGILQTSFSNVSESINSFDLHTTLQSGFCYSRYSISGEKTTVSLNQPFLQVGKYKGDFPFIVEISGEYQNKLFSQKIIIPEENTLNIDTIAEEIWVGQYIKSLEYGPQRNDIVSEIVSSSLNYRVLSLYTSFLCLEKNAQICVDCWNNPNGQVTGDGPVKTSIATGLKDSIRVYPNPFVENITIELNCVNPEDVKELAVYNLTGSVIWQFDVDKIHSGNNILNWNGSDNRNTKVKTGVYLLVFRTSTERKTVKLLRN
ncbi:MAG: VIT domain-containing protein [Prolixibacteraceae bacterium]